MAVLHKRYKTLDDIRWKSYLLFICQQYNLTVGENLPTFWVSGDVLLRRKDLLYQDKNQVNSIARTGLRLL